MVRVKAPLLAAGPPTCAATVSALQRQALQRLRHLQLAAVPRMHCCSWAARSNSVNRMHRLQACLQRLAAPNSATCCREGTPVCWALAQRRCTTAQRCPLPTRVRSSACAACVAVAAPTVVVGRGCPPMPLRGRKVCSVAQLIQPRSLRCCHWRLGCCCLWSLLHSIQHHRRHRCHLSCHQLRLHRGRSLKAPCQR